MLLLLYGTGVAAADSAGPADAAFLAMLLLTELRAYSARRDHVHIVVLVLV